MQASKKEVARRKPFEDAIKRPYFHVKPLDGNQLTAWSRLLDYVEGCGNDEATVHLYERCLVACAKYPGLIPIKLINVGNTCLVCCLGVLLRFCCNVPAEGTFHVNLSIKM